MVPTATMTFPMMRWSTMPRQSTGRSQKYGGIDYYEPKLRRVMERFGATSLNYGIGPDAAWIEFRIREQLYRFDHSTAKALKAGIKVNRGSDVFAQLVLALEDLARLTERGIYTLATWLSGLKALPSTTTVPSCFAVLGFAEIPDSLEDINARYKTKALRAHPDQGGDMQRWHELQAAVEQAKCYLAERSGAAK